MMEIITKTNILLHKTNNKIQLTLIKLNLHIVFNFI